MGSQARLVSAYRDKSNVTIKLFGSCSDRAAASSLRQIAARLLRISCTDKLALTSCNKINLTQPFFLRFLISLYIAYNFGDGKRL